MVQAFRGALAAMPGERVLGFQNLEYEPLGRTVAPPEACGLVGCEGCGLFQSGL